MVEYQRYMAQRNHPEGTAARCSFPEDHILSEIQALRYVLHGPS